MELISIIEGFVPRKDARLLSRAEELTPPLIRTKIGGPSAVWAGDQPIAPEQLAARPLRAGDQVTLDFGRHIVGRLALRLETSGSHPDAPAFLQVDFAETERELTERPEDYHGWLSPGWIQREQIHVDELPARVELPRRYAFRYVRVTVLATSPKYALRLAETSCTAESSADWARVPPREIRDEELRRIYEAGLRTLHSCTQTVLEDGPKRDRRLWIGDLRLEALGSYASFGSHELVKRCLYLLAGSCFPDGRASANIFTTPEPAGDDTYLADYALLYPVTMAEYLRETGDDEALRDLGAFALAQVDQVLARLDGDGLVTGETARESFIDWSDDLDRRASVQGVLLIALDAAAALCGRAGDARRQADYAGTAARLRTRTREALWSEADGCFRSGGQISLHSQVWLTLADAMPEGRAAGALARALREPGAPRMATPYMHHYYVEALRRAGLRDEAIRHLRDYWGGMLRAGADTFWECWDPEHPDASPYGGSVVDSHCHAWSCTPVFLIPELLGE